MRRKLGFRVLGPLEVIDADGRRLELGGPRPRALLAILVLRANEVVARDVLIDELWQGAPPGTAATALQGYVSSLRKTLEPDRPAGAPGELIVTREPGYMLAIEDDQLDLASFTRLVDQGRGALEAGDAKRAAELLREAQSLWRGPPLADLRDTALALGALRYLDELRAAAAEDLIDAELARGRHREVLPEIERLIAQHPFRERLRGQAMIALYRSGRQADALEAYREARTSLAGELGIEPGPALRALEAQVLAHDPALNVPAAAPAAAALGPEPVSAVSRPRRPRSRRRRPAAAALALAVAATAAVLIASSGDSPEAVRVVGNAVAVIDPGSGRVEAVVDVGGTPTSVAADAGGAWVLNADDGTVSRVTTSGSRASTFATGSVPTELAAGAGALWVGSGKRTASQFVGPVALELSRLDPITHSVQATIKLPRRAGATSNATQHHIAVGAGGVWAVNPDFTVSRVDPATTEIRSTVGGVGALAVSTSADSVWILGEHALLARIDPRRGSVAQRIRVPATELSDIAVGAGSVWATDPNEGTLWRVDPTTPPVERTIDVGSGASAVAFGARSVWVLNQVRGTLLQVDPETNRVRRTIDVGNTPRRVAVGAGKVWVTVAGGPGAALPAGVAGERSSGAATSACGPPVTRRGASDPLVVVSDFPLRGGPRLPTVQMADAIAFTFRRHGFRAGRYDVAYQSCDDSTEQTGIFDPAKCAANAKAYAAARRVVAVIGPFNSACAHEQIPIAARAGPLALASPTNSSVGLVRPVPGARLRVLRALYPGGRRNYVRLAEAEDIQGAAGAEFARRRGGRVFVLSDGGYGESLAAFFRRAARRAHVRVLGSGRWDPRARGYRTLARRVAATRPRVVYVSGLLDTNGGRLVRDLRSALPPSVVLLANDGFLPISGLFATAGAAARGTYVTVPGAPLAALGRRARTFVKDFGAAQPGRPVDPAAAKAAAAAEVVLGAIARSDGTRSSITRALFGTDRQTVAGRVRFDRAGDIVGARITVVRALRGGGSDHVGSADGAEVAAVLTPPPSLVR